MAPSPVVSLLQIEAYNLSCDPQIEAHVLFDLHAEGLKSRVVRQSLREYGTYKTVKARLWFWRSGQGPVNLSNSS